MKHVVMLSTCAPGGMAQVIESLRSSGLFERYGVRFIRTHDRGSLWLRLRVFVFAYTEFCVLLLAGRISVVHAHVAMRGSFWRKSLFLGLARLFRRPTIVHLHGSQFEAFYEQECGNLQRAIVRLILRSARAVIVLSRNWQAYVRQVEPRTRIVVVHNFVDLSAIGTAVESERAARSRSTILFLGEIGTRKGVYDLIKAMPAVLQRCPDARLIAAGSGELDTAAACARELGVEHAVSLPGWIAGKQKLKLLSQASVYVLPSHNENFPVSILEAMAAGLPVVTTPVGGIPDMVRDGHEGYLVQPAHVGELADALSALLCNQDLRLKMGDAGRLRVAARFCSEEALRNLDTLYRENGAHVYPVHGSPNHGV